MLSGWYCRSMANMQANSEAEQDDDRDIGGGDSDDDSRDDLEVPVDYKAQYTTLKRKLKFLLYENESFQSALQSSQRRHLKVSRDRSFLLDRLLQYEKVDPSSSESDETESSEDETSRQESLKRRRENSQINNHGGSANVNSVGKNQPPTKKKKTAAPKQNSKQNSIFLHQNQARHLEHAAVPINTLPSALSDGHMTPEEVERHLQSRQSFRGLVPERAPPTVPTEMFSNDPSLDSESNDLLETSPSNIGEDCLSMDMNMMAE